MCKSIFNKTLWFQYVRKIKFDIKLYTSSLARRKDFFKMLSHYTPFKRFFITDHSLLKDYNLKVYEKIDLETNMTFCKSLKLETL